MRERSRGMRAACALLGIALALGACACALAEEEKEGTINYSVRAVLPQNQRDDTAAYFDLWVGPGQEQVLEVVIRNRAAEDIEVALEANTAFSNDNGVIEFEASQAKDSSMAIDFAQLVSPREPVIAVPANGEAVARFDLRMPEEAFEGVVYGGLTFMKLGQEETPGGEDGGSFGIRNVYRYVIGVRLWESDAVIEPGFELTGAQVGQTRRASLQLNLRNPQPVIARGMTLLAEVYPAGGGEAIASFARENVSMAPNSAMDYTIYLDDNRPLPAGEYSVRVALDFQGKTWQFETPLAVH